MSAPEPASSATFYRWRDTQGLEHLVDSIEKVPEASRANAERISMAAAAVRKEQQIGTGTGTATATGTATGAADGTGMGPVRIEWESFAAGFATAFVLTFVFVMARRTKKPLLELAVLMAAAAVIGGVYFAWSKRRESRSTAGTQPIPADISNKRN
jgi:hypothetical protein